MESSSSSLLYAEPFLENQSTTTQGSKAPSSFQSEIIPHLKLIMVKIDVLERKMDNIIGLMEDEKEKCPGMKTNKNIDSNHGRDEVHSPQIMLGPNDNGCNLYDASQGVTTVHQERQQLATGFASLNNEQPSLHENDSGTLDVDGSTTSEIQPPNDVLGYLDNSEGRRLSWAERMKQLEQYKRFHGNCDVPQIYHEQPGLGAWVSAQRSQYKRSSLDGTRRKSLEAIGFNWSLRNRVSWDERYAELKEFCERNNGSCDVPNSKEYRQLNQWCQNQRQAYKRGLQGKASQLLPERIKKLEQIGFNWQSSNAGQSLMPELHQFHVPPQQNESPTNDTPENNDLTKACYDLAALSAKDFL